eukprot:3036581-Amphidinium_carterae.1
MRYHFLSKCIASVGKLAVPNLEEPCSSRACYYFASRLGCGFGGAYRVPKLTRSLYQCQLLVLRFTAKLLKSLTSKARCVGQFLSSIDVMSLLTTSTDQEHGFRINGVV